MERRSLLKYAGTLAVGKITAVPFSNGTYLEVGKNEARAETDPPMKIQRLSWAGIKIQSGATTLFVDASVSEGDPKLVSETESRHAIITHHHGDHYDSDALQSVLKDNSWLIYNQDIAPFIDSKKFRPQTSKLYEPVFISRGTGDLVAIAVPAADGFGHPQVSWVIKGGGKTIIHCGDTLWHGHWWDIARSYGPFDIAFLPINGFRQIAGRYTDSGIPMSLTPFQAVAAAKLLGAKKACPIHYGRSDTNYIEVPEPEKNFLQFAADKNQGTILPKTGEWLAW